MRSNTRYDSITDRVYTASRRLVQRHFPERKLYVRQRIPASTLTGRPQGTLSDNIVLAVKASADAKAMGRAEGSEDDCENGPKLRTSALSSASKERILTNKSNNSGIAGSEVDWKARKRRRVGFAENDKENAEPDLDPAASRVDGGKLEQNKGSKRPHRKLTNSSRGQSTLTQIDYIQRNTLDQRTTSVVAKESGNSLRKKKRKRSFSNDRQMRQQTITQMDFARMQAYGIQALEDVDHLGYGFLDADTCETPSVGAIASKTERTYPNSTPSEHPVVQTATASHTPPPRSLPNSRPVYSRSIPDSEDEGEDSMDAGYPDMLVHSNQLANPIVEDIMPLAGTPSSATELVTAEGPAFKELEPLKRSKLMSTPDKQRVLEIPSSQTPPLQRRFEKPSPAALSGQLSPSRHGSESVQQQTTILRSDLVNRSTCEEPIESPVKESPEGTQVSPTKKRVQEFNARFAELSRLSANSRRNLENPRVPSFIPSSTKTSLLSAESETCETLRVLEPQFTIGEETQAELRMGTCYSAAEHDEESIDRLEADPNVQDYLNAAGTDTKDLTTTPSYAQLAMGGERGNGRTPSSSTAVRKAPLELFWSRSSLKDTANTEPTTMNDNEEGSPALQDQASHQLLRETRESIDGEETSADSASSSINATTSSAGTPTIRSTQIDRVEATSGRIPHTPTYNQAALSRVLIPSSSHQLGFVSCSSPTESRRNSEAAAICGPSSPTRSESVLCSTLFEPSPIPRSSPFTGTYCFDEQRLAENAVVVSSSCGNSVTPSALLPESLMNDSIPRPPTWTEDEDV